MIRVSISDDGATWEHYQNFTNGITTKMRQYYIESFNQSILFLRFDLLTDGSVSPVLYEIHVVYLLTEVYTGMIFGDVNWMIAFIWFFVMGIGYLTKKFELKIIGAIIGIVFGLMILSLTQLIGLLLVILNIVVMLWEAKSQ